MQSVNSYRELVCSSDLSLKYQQELLWELNGSWIVHAQYVSASAPKGNVLVQDIQTAASKSLPEPGTLSLVLTGMLGMIWAAAFWRR